MEEAVIREGLLCPICMQDLGTIAQLQEHFQLSHFDDKDMIDQLKGLFGKAKRKLLKKARDAEGSLGSFIEEVTAGDSDSFSQSAASAGGIDSTMWEPQELGVTRSLTGTFKAARDRRIDYFVVETNKLLIRLDKLISPDAPTDTGKRKAYERSVVPWAPDADVTICATCGRRFTLTRRRHHCRLCGAILCNHCSQFLPFTHAKRLTQPSSVPFDGSRPAAAGGCGFESWGSNSSLNSLLGTDGEQHIRTCHLCRRLLETRQQQVAQRYAKPAISLLYEKVRNYMKEVDHLVPSLSEMSESLCAGETMYNLETAEITRDKIVKLCEIIDDLSKRIASLCEPDGGVSASSLQLQKAVRASATACVQQSLLHAQCLPTAAQLQRLHDQRLAQRREEERQLREQREREEARLRERQRAEVASSSGGWRPAEAAAVGGQDDDPMVQQMNIIRSYVKQATQAQRWDEVQMLEENLKQLQLEYWNAK